MSTLQQIKRWLAYQYVKDNDMDPKDVGPKNPYRVLLHQLTGVAIQKPRCKPAASLWRKSYRTEIEAEVQKRAQAKGVDSKRLAPLRESIIRELFNELPKVEQEEWAHLAKEEHEEALQKWEKEVKSPPSSDPKDRQQYVYAYW